MATTQLLFTYFAMISVIMLPALGELSPDFYDEVCPLALPTIKVMVEQAIALEPRMGASLVRLHFHDCFVNGCDGSILLDDTPTFTSEKTAVPNNNSVRGFDVIDRIKAAVNVVCLGNVVSCADVLAVAARDSVVAVSFIPLQLDSIDIISLIKLISAQPCKYDMVTGVSFPISYVATAISACTELYYHKLDCMQLGGSSYDVLLGRRDTTTASRDAANANLPNPFLDLPDLITNFESHGLGLEDLVVLSGAHTLGFSRCLLFRNRIYNETSTIDGDFAASLQAVCPPSGDDDKLAPFDESPVSFDTAYYQDLVESRGLLHSDQQLFKGDGSSADELVQKYGGNPDAFWADFGTAMLKMGNISPLTGSDGEIRENCRVVN